MRHALTTLLSTAFLAALVGGCAPAESGSQPDEPAASESDYSQRQQLSDAAIAGKLRGILRDVTFTSESDYPYVVLEGDAVASTQRRLTSTLVRQKLQAAVRAESSSHRDILPRSCRAERVSVSHAIADGDAAVVPADHDDDDFVYAFHDKQLGIALKVMRSQLRGVVGYTFGTNESGDQDDVGPVLYVYVGISKTTGKLIAIMTEAVYT